MPGGPHNSTPEGVLALSTEYLRASLRHATTSRSSSLAVSTPATSAKVMGLLFLSPFFFGLQHESNLLSVQQTIHHCADPCVPHRRKVTYHLFALACNKHVSNNAHWCSTISYFWSTGMSQGVSASSEMIFDSAGKSQLILLATKDFSTKQMHARMHVCTNEIMTHQMEGERMTEFMSE